MKRLNKKQCSFYVDEKDLTRFQEMFPRTLTLFLGRCIKAALTDKELFNRIFWNF